MRKYVSKLSLPWAGLTPKTPWFPKVESSSWNHPSLLSSLFWRPHQILCRLCPRSLARTSSLAESRAPLTHPGMQLFKACIQHSVRWFQGMPFKYFGSTSPVSSRGRRWGPLVQWRARNTVFVNALPCVLCKHLQIIKRNDERARVVHRRQAELGGGLCELLGPTSSPNLKFPSGERLEICGEVFK